MGELVSFTAWRKKIMYDIMSCVQRCKRGWADKDTWSFDVYLAGVVAGGLKYLAQHNHSCPGRFPGGAEGWTKWLEDQAEWWRWYARNSIFGSSEEKDIDIHQNKLNAFHKQILPEFIKHYNDLWD